MQTCNPEAVETTMHVRVKIANWNISVQEWLRKCVYERFTYRNKMKSQLATFLVSSFWHGYYGGYYISFFLWFCHQYVSQLIFKEGKKPNSPFRALYKSTGIVGKVALWLSSNIIFSVSGIFFQVLSLSHSVSILRSLYFTPLLAYLLAIGIFTKFATRDSKKTPQADRFSSLSTETSDSKKE